MPTPHCYSKSKAKPSTPKNLRLLFQTCVYFCKRHMTLRSSKRLDLFPKFTNGLPIGEMPLMPRCIILWGTAHHHNKPLSIKITEVLNEHVEAFRPKLVV